MVVVATVADKADATRALRQEVKATAHALKPAAMAKKHATRTHAATAAAAHNAMAQVVAKVVAKVVQAVVTPTKALGQSAVTKPLVMHPGETAVALSAKTASAASHVTTAARVSQTRCAPALTP